MPTLDELTNLYAKAATCQNGCAGIRNEPERGVIGRSYYCPFDPTDVNLLMVSKNPGIGCDEENKIYQPLSGKERVFAHEKFVTEAFQGGNRMVTSMYHRNILSWVSIVLGVEDSHDAVFRKAALTALVKCESWEIKTDKLPEPTINRCSDEYLFCEIEIIRPSFLLALGGEVYSYLTDSSIRDRHNLPVGKLYHPSWTNMRGGVEKYKSEALPKLREQYLEACAT